MAKKKTLDEFKYDLFLEEEDSFFTLKDIASKQSNYRVYSTGNLMLDCAIGETDKLTGRKGIPERTMVESFGRTSSLKCFGKGTQVMMADGSSKAVEDIKAGDYVLSPTGEPRKVLETHSGKDTLYRVTSTKGQSFVCNGAHILSLKTSGLEISSKRIKFEKSPGVWIGGEKREYIKSYGDTVSISVEDFLKLSQRQKSFYRLYRSECLEFKSKNNPKLELDPYYLGLWLGDGNSRKPNIYNQDIEVQEYLEYYAKELNLKCVTKKSKSCPDIGITSGRGIDRKITKRGSSIKGKLRMLSLLNNKHIPEIYKTSSIKDRLQLLAGLLDSDGYIKGTSLAVIVQKNEILSKDIVFLCRSLGFNATISKTKSYCIYKGERKEGLYNSIHISGDLSKVPLKIKRKQVPATVLVRNPLYARFRIEKLEPGEFYGFSIDGPDKLFLLSDFTVVHNSAQYEQLVKNVIQDDPENIVIILYTEESDLDRWESIGVTEEERERIIVLGCTEGQDVMLHLAEKNLDRIKIAVQDARVKLVVIDSLKGLCLAKQLYGKKGEITALEDGEQLAIRAKLIGEFIRDFKQLNKKAILYMTNQTSDKIQLNPYDNIQNPQFTIQTPGGRAKEFECQLRLQQETRPIFVDKEHELTGKKILIGWELSTRLVKNKFCRSTGNRVAVANFYFNPPGFSRLQQVITLSLYLSKIGKFPEELKLSKTLNGRWTIPGSEGSLLNRELKDYFEAHPELIDKLEKAIMDNSEDLFKSTEEVNEIF